ncbi:MAG: hypothetical protein M3O25_08835 [Actinomycetota bacterium]|nr:hypothetical protein [Actinomycetota bacterium]
MSHDDPKPDEQRPTGRSDRADDDSALTASDTEEKLVEPSDGEDQTSPEPGPSGEESTDLGTPAEHESEVIAAPEPGGQGDPDPRPSREGVKRVLIFLNEVAGGRMLLQACRELKQGGAEYFAVVAPQNQPLVGQLVDADELREAAQSRIDVTLSLLAEFGIEAEGAVMDRDVALALDDACRATKPDYVLLSALYETRFGLTRKDLVEWAKVNLDVRVEHIPVRVEDDAVRWDIVHTLVVATKTVNSPDLLGHLKQRAEDKPHRYTFICPRSGDVTRQQVCSSLAATLAELYREDVDATGQPMSPDPFHAIQNAVEHYRLDEILISTLKGEQSAWLAEGLIDRVKQITDLPVEHIESGAGSSTAQPLAAATGGGS